MSSFEYTTDTKTKFIKPSRKENIHILIQNLKQHTDEFTEEKNIPHQYEMYQDLFNLWVTPTNYNNQPHVDQKQNENSQSQLLNDVITVPSVIDTENFIFQFYLWMSYKNTYCKYQFKYSWTQLKDFCSSKKHQLCFVDKSWPQWFLNTNKMKLQINKILDNKLNMENLNDEYSWYAKRHKMAQQQNIDTKEFILKNIENEMNKMKTLEEYMTFETIDIGKGPGESGWIWNRNKRRATMKDASNAAYILCKIFNCPKLVLTADFFTYFPEFEDEMKKLLPILAHNTIQHLCFIGYNWFDANYHYQHDLRCIVENKFWKHKNAHRQLLINRTNSLSEYHHVYVMIKQLKSFHWALKFVGINKLLTVEYFNNARVWIQLLENNAMNQIIFWYGDAAHYDECTFSKRWNVIHKQRLDPLITAGQIGHWIDLWIKKYPTYHPLTNDCQHFVRDIMSAIDLNAGKLLIDKMQRLKLNRSIWPSNIKKEEEERTIEISKELKLYGMFQRCIDDAIVNNSKFKPYVVYKADTKQDEEANMHCFDQLKQYSIDELRKFDENGLKAIGMNEENDRIIYLKYKHLLNSPV